MVKDISDISTEGLKGTFRFGNKDIMVQESSLKMEESGDIWIEIEMCLSEDCSRGDKSVVV